MARAPATSVAARTSSIGWSRFMLDRRTLLKWSGALPLLESAGEVSAGKERAPVIDTHLEVWTFDPKFPFHHPERPDLKRVEMEAPIENQVAQMQEFGLRYAVLI